MWDCSRKFVQAKIDDLKIWQGKKDRRNGPIEVICTQVNFDHSCEATD